MRKLKLIALLSLATILSAVKGQTSILNGVEESIAFDLITKKNTDKALAVYEAPTLKAQLISNGLSEGSSESSEDVSEGKVLRIKPLKGKNMITVQNGTGAILHASIINLKGELVSNLGNVGSFQKISTSYLPGGKYVLLLQNVNTGEKITQRFNKRFTQI